MIRLLVLLLTPFIALSSLRFPWTGVIFYYTIAIWAPQFIWWFAFRSIRLQLIVAGATLVGLLWKILQGRISLDRLWNRQNIFLLILCISTNIGDWFSDIPYDSTNPHMLNPELMLSGFNKTVLFYYIGIVLIDDLKKFKFLVYSFISIIIFYTGWANYQFLTHNTEYFSEAGRLCGPFSYHAGGIYQDENSFSMLFVVGIPFLYFLGASAKRNIIKYVLWGTIPWAWHAVFLTSSRMGLIGTGIVSLFIAYRSQSKFLGTLLICGLFAAFMWQGGELRNRVETTVNSQKENSTSNAGPIDPRIIAWSVHSQIMMDHPLIGVGMSKSLAAFPRYSDSMPLVAHNTFLQFAGESGVLAGLMYLFIIFSIILAYIKEGGGQRIDPFLILCNHAIIGALTGFFICSNFLNLAYYESFYYLITLSLIRQNLSHNIASDLRL